MSIDSAHALRVEIARLTQERDEARTDAANLRFVNDKAREACAVEKARADAAEARIVEVEELYANSEVARMVKLNAETTESLAAARRDKNAAYAERNQCVALIVRMALALGWRAGVRDHEDKPGEEWESDWRNLVCIDLPTGQVSWHFHDSEKHLLAGLPQYPAPWDGHDTAEKYRRVNAALAAPASAPGKET